MNNNINIYKQLKRYFHNRLGMTKIFGFTNLKDINYEILLFTMYFINMYVLIMLINKN